MHSEQQISQWQFQMDLNVFAPFIGLYPPSPHSSGFLFIQPCWVTRVCLHWRQPAELVNWLFYTSSRQPPSPPPAWYAKPMIWQILKGTVSRNGPVLCFCLKLIIHVIKCQIHLVRQFPYDLWTYYKRIMRLMQLSRIVVTFYQMYLVRIGPNWGICIGADKHVWKVRF